MRTARSRSSVESLCDSLIAPRSQEFESPSNPGRFSCGFSSLGVRFIGCSFVQTRQDLDRHFGAYPKTVDLILKGIAKYLYAWIVSCVHKVEFLK